MPVPVLMPALSPTMEKGKLAKWHVREGDEIRAGDVIAEIETDKATMEVEAIEEGRIGKLHVAEGAEDVAVNTPIATILTDDENKNEAVEGMELLLEPEIGADPSIADELVSESKPTVNEQQGEKAFMQSSSANYFSHGYTSGEASESRIFASPLARRIAKDKQINLAAITGTGPHGRIIKKDVEQVKSAGVKVPSTGTTIAVTPGSGMATTGGAVAIPDREIFALYEEGSYEVLPHDNMRKVIADRLTLAKTTIPHFYLTIDCDLDSLLEARARLNETVVPEGVRLSVNDFIIKALALALHQVPEANATWSSQGLLLHRQSDIAVAVAVDGGLYTPVLRAAESKSLATISSEMKGLAYRARNKRLAPHEYQGGTTSISNLGMYDIKQFEAVINPPHASILAVGRGEQRVIVKDGQVQTATMMSCTLSCDHRVIDGALGAELLKVFKTFIEHPVAMLV